MSARNDRAAEVTLRATEHAANEARLFAMLLDVQGDAGLAVTERSRLIEKIDDQIDARRLAWVMT